MQYHFLLVFLIIIAGNNLTAQDLTIQLRELEDELAQIENSKQTVLSQIERVKLALLREDLYAYGLPALNEGEKVIHHEAMSLVYEEKHEQAKWVAHIILPDILKGEVSRTNDFREDPLVETGTAVEADYFLKYLQADSTYEYDGFGYDRGHLAPSADFRWSEIALSESYFYSNMSPQVAEFNRNKWAALEGAIRGYVARHPDVTLFVVTGPILKEGLPVVERGVNKVTIPELYWKVVVDLKNKSGIGFIMPNKAIEYPLSSFAVNIDKVEEETGIDFFHNLPDDQERQIEQSLEKELWLPEIAEGDADPIFPPTLPKDHFNTIQAKRFMNYSKPIKVCGQVVSARKSQKGNILINLDKQYPNQVFTVFIKKDQLINFSYDPKQKWMGQKICVEGKISNFSGMPATFIDQEGQIKPYSNNQ